MTRTEPRGAAAPIALAMLFAGACLPLCGCHPEEVPAEENYVTVRLHDSLSRLARVEVLILSAADTSQLVGKVWDGRLETPSSLPPYRLSETETLPLAIRVRGFDSAGALVHDQLITKTDGRQVVTSLLPPASPLPNPVPARPTPSVRLSALAVFPGTLAPDFDSLRNDYQVRVPFEQGSIAVTATAVSDSAAILIEGIPVASGVATEPYDLQVGANELGIRVTVGDSTGLYSLKVDRAQRVDPPDTSSPSDWNPAYRDWMYKAAVDVDVMPLGLGRGWVEGFPLLIRLTKENFTFSQAAAGGRDLRFTRLGMPIEYEIARWDTAARLAEIWVRLDTVRCDTAFAALTLYWGNPAATPASDPDMVFTPAAGYSGVWHLSESAVGNADEYRDATGRYHGRGIGDPYLPAVPRRVEGVVGYGQAFRTDSAYSAIDLPFEFDPGSKQRWTFQCWVKSESGGRAVLFAKGIPKPAPVQRFQIVLDGSGQQIALYRDGDTARSNVYIGKETFFHIGISYDGSLTKFFLDGIEKETLTGWSQGGGGGGGAVIGSRDREASQLPFQGSLDELWFSNQVRSKEWMRLAYENQKPNSNLVLVGAAALQK